MKKSDLKSMIKECVREVLFEEGVLSSVIAEVAHGIATAQYLISETNSPPVQPRAEAVDTSKSRKAAAKSRLNETKKKMLSAIGNKSMAGVFEGTQPLASSGEVSQHSPLSGLDSADSGVDISGLIGVASDAWKRLK